MHTLNCNRNLGINLNRGAGNLTSMAMLGQCQCYCPAMPGNVSGAGAGSREEVTTFPAAWGHDARDVYYLQAEYLHCTQQPHTALHYALYTDFSCN